VDEERVFSPKLSEGKAAEERAAAPGSSGLFSLRTPGAPAPHSHNSEHDRVFVRISWISNAS